MAATHTIDGPWIDSGLTGPNPRISGGPLRLVKCEGVVIAFLPAWLDDEHEEAQANARLVAAAPDLLAALQDLIANVTEAMKTGGWVPTPLHQSFWLSMADAGAAIAKATGEAP